MPPTTDPALSDSAPAPRLAIRRHTDRCFFEVEEVVPDAQGRLRGYIVEGTLIDREDVAEVIELDEQGRRRCAP